MPPVGYTGTTVDEHGVEFHYRVIAEGAAQIERCNTRTAHVEIPEKLDGLQVVSLGENSFSNLFSVEAVHCGHCLKHIGDRAFFGCSRLKELRLNEGLERIGSETVGLCLNLPCLNIPASVRDLGQTPATSMVGGGEKTGVALRISSANKHLFAADDGAVYRRVEDGLVLVDATRIDAEELVVLPETRVVAARACASNSSLKNIVLPEGLREIGDEAFCGCTNLCEIKFPTTLETLGDSALSFTSVRSLDLPASLVNVSEFAFNLGHSQPELRTNAFTSRLRSITVDEGNPLLLMVGPMLCRHTPKGLEALLCTMSDADVHLTRDIASVAPIAFAGTPNLGTLRLHEGIRFAASGLLPHKSCSRLVIDLDTPRNGAEQVVLEMSKGASGRNVLAASLTAGTIDLELLLANYDEAVANDGTDPLEQARQMVARLANPVCLAPDVADAYTSAITDNINSICAHFGARNYWEGFDQLFSAGILDEQGAAQAVDLLTRVGDTAAAAYVLQLKHQHCGHPVWDYEL